MKSVYFTTDDGIDLHYVEAGDPTAQPLIFLPSWSLTAQLWSTQLRAFASKYLVFVLEPRGHGVSEKCEGGYRMARMAKDVENFLEAINCGTGNANIVAHGASCPVMWTFIELFGQEKIHSLVFVDSSTCFHRNPEWSDGECRNYGACGTEQETRDFINQLTGKDGDQVTAKWFRFVCGHYVFSERDIQLLTSESLKMTRDSAAKMLWNERSGDYRDILPDVTVPVLCIGASHSYIPVEAMRWAASEMENTEFLVLAGTHFMFLQDPGSFNMVLDIFLQSMPYSFRPHPAIGPNVAIIPDDDVLA